MSAVLITDCRRRQNEVSDLVSLKHHFVMLFEFLKMSAMRYEVYRLNRLALMGRHKIDLCTIGRVLSYEKI